MFWWGEHLQGMMGSYIAAWTAFLVVTVGRFVHAWVAMDRAGGDRGAGDCADQGLLQEEIFAEGEGGGLGTAGRNRFQSVLSRGDGDPLTKTLSHHFRKHEVLERQCDTEVAWKIPPSIVNRRSAPLVMEVQFLFTRHRLPVLCCWLERPFLHRGNDHFVNRRGPALSRVSARSPCRVHQSQRQAPRLRWFHGAG